MRTWANGTLPIFVCPLPGEALDSWLESYARRLSVTLHAFLSHIGLLGSQPGTTTQRLAAAEREVLHQATGLSHEALVTMTLEPYDGLTVAFDKTKDTSMRRPPAWRYHGSNSRFCPHCLDGTGGRWLLSWRQPWSFACPQHHCLLLEQCPACQQPVRAHGTRVGGPSRPTHCTRGRREVQGTRWLRIACDFPLDQAPAHSLPPHGLVIGAQHHVSSLLDVIVHDPGPAQEQLRDLYALGWRGLGSLARGLQTAPAVVNQVLEETGGQPPIQAHAQDATDIRSIAVGTTLARLAAPHPAPSNPELFDWILEASHRSSRAKDRTGARGRAHAWKSASPRLAGLALAPLDSNLTLMTRLRYGTASPRPYWRELTAPQLARRVASVPARLWPSWTMRLLAPSGRSANSFRQVVSNLLILPGTRLDYGPAADLLGPTPRQGALKGLPKILDNYPPTPLAAVIAQLAWALDEHGSPIDYTRRRRLFRPDTITLDLHAWESICADTDWPGDHMNRTELVRWQLLALLHGADPEPTQKIANHYHFRLQLSSGSEAFLQEQARANLARFEIDEPISWEPPSSWATLPSWPGYEIDAVDQALAQRLASQAFSEGYVAKQLGLPITHFRLFAESRGLILAPANRTAPARPRNPFARTRGKGIPRAGHLAPDQLRDQYLHQRMTRSEIAALAGCSHTTVKNALLEAGIPLRPRRPNGALERTVPRDWLTQQYLTRGRSTPDIARELGLRKGAITKLLRAYGIPRHPPGTWSNPFAPLDLRLSSAMQAVSRTSNSLERLRHIIQIPGHHNLSAAAATAGLTPGSLSYQLSRIEEAAGFTLIARTHPLTATEAGHAFLAEAQQLLELLNAHPK